MHIYSSQEWAREPRFASFWAHYEAAEKWRRKHVEISRKAVEMAVVGQDRNKTKSYKSTAIRPSGGVQIQEPACSHEPEYEAMDHDNYEGDYEQSVEEISQEYLEFRRKTLEHQRQRSIQKEKEAKEEVKDSNWFTANDVDYILADKIGVHGPKKRTKAAPDELQRNAKRREEAKKLYGENAEKILAMETTIEMRFDEEYRRRNPPLWPNIPLKL